MFNLYVLFWSQKSLKEMFPIEAGQIERKDRIIPSLPGKNNNNFHYIQTDRVTFSHHCHLSFCFISKLLRWVLLLAELADNPNKCWGVSKFRENKLIFRVKTLLCAVMFQEAPVVIKHMW